MEDDAEESRIEDEAMEQLKRKVPHSGEGYVLANVITQIKKGQRVLANHCGEWFEAQVTNVVNQSPLIRLKEMIQLSQQCPNELHEQSIKLLKQEASSRKYEVHFLRWSRRFDGLKELSELKVTENCQKRCRLGYKRDAVKYSVNVMKLALAELFCSETDESMTFAECLESVEESWKIKEKIYYQPSAIQNGIMGPVPKQSSQRGIEVKCISGSGRIKNPGGIEREIKGEMSFDPYEEGSNMIQSFEEYQRMLEERPNVGFSLQQVNEQGIDANIMVKEEDVDEYGSDSMSNSNYQEMTMSSASEYSLQPVKDEVTEVPVYFNGEGSSKASLEYLKDVKTEEENSEYRCEKMMDGLKEEPYEATNSLPNPGMCGLLAVPKQESPTTSLYKEHKNAGGDDYEVKKEYEN